ncbi:MAG: BspA family leucine-rich repeat surface protein [Saprospiraceae bacterium]|jgi:surface protein|nr:BspA family leucine-rich repeat surface protein [Saprospiraceae bacterium]
MKAKNLIIGHLIFVIAFLLFSFKLRGQNFITEWTFGKTTNQIHFNAETTDTVTYTWSALPSGNTGSGIFIQTTADTVRLRNLDVLKGDTLKLSMNPSKLRRFYIDNGPDKTNLINVIQWGSVPWTSMNSAFKGCAHLKIDAKDNPDLSNVVDLSYMFSNASSFNQDIGNWNTENIVIMAWMLNGASSFNQDIGSWNTSNVVDMSYLFQHASSFNQNIGDWNTSKVTDMRYMFSNTISFNQDIGRWNTGNVIYMHAMFLNAHLFNKNIGNWNTSNVDRMSGMFSNAKAFNQDIGNWNTSNVITMHSMFADAINFNQDIGRWNTTNVIDMTNLFLRASSFNQDIGNWNTENVNKMINMFNSASSFNQDIGGWNIVQVSTMASMFRHTKSFNQDISNWNTSNVKDMYAMFSGASAFNQNIGNWILHPKASLLYLFDSTNLDCINYSATLIGWRTNNPNVNQMNLGVNGLLYGKNAEDARNALINSQGWYIKGDAPSGNDCEIVGTHNEESLSDIFLYPNPTSGILNIEDNNGSIYSISDLTGKFIVKGIITMNTISLEMLPLGIYYLSIINSDSPQTIKVFKY